MTLTSSFYTIIAKIICVFLPLVLDPENSEKNHVAVQEAYIERMAPMLPGTTTKIVKLLKRNFPSQGHKIKTKCLDLWTKLVTSIISDANVQLEPTMRYFFLNKLVFIFDASDWIV